MERSDRCPHFNELNKNFIVTLSEIERIFIVFNN